MRFLLILCLSLVTLRAQAQELTVFAAASLTDALTNVSVKWASAGHLPLRLYFGSSSTLAHQIELGASANLFASADTKWMDYLADHKLIVPETRKVLLGNDLILIMPRDEARRVIIKPGFDLPALNGVVVIALAGREPCGPCRVAGLVMAGAVDGPALQQRGIAVPGTFQAEAGEALRQHRT